MTGPRRHGSPFVTEEGHRIGSGWISGTLGAVLGIAGLGAALCFAFPGLLATEFAREHAPAWLRLAAIGALAAAAASGVLSLCLRRKKTLGLIAISSAACGAAVLIVPPTSAADGSPVVALDVFALNLLLYTAVFVPVERIWPRLDQPTFRPEWWTDFAWFASSALLVQAVTWLVLAPGTALAAAVPWFADRMRLVPVWLQFPLLVLAADLVQYSVHRAFHAVPWLWSFHRVHHSAEAMDWLAGSRLHLVDALATRAAVFAAIALLGFDLRAVALYLVFVGTQATFVHANVNWRLGWLEPFLVTPRFHHWHHAGDVVDVNFAVHLPWIDRLFGTWHLPGQGWPERYGVADGKPVWRGFWAQMWGPFRSRLR